MTTRRGLKVCGVTRLEDVETCCALGVDAIGFNLWPGSSRAIDLAAARLLVDRVARPGPLRVAVVVDPSDEDLARLLGELDLDLVQFHGQRVAESYAPLSIDHVRVVRGTPELDALAAPGAPPRWTLLDAATPGWGGRGVMHDWSWAARATATLSSAARWGAVWLAGGITPDNAAAAIVAVDPAGLDVASGAEDGVPGVKSAARIAALRAICDNVGR